MKTGPALALTLFALLLFISAAQGGASAQGTQSTAYLDVSESEVRIEQGGSRTLHVSIFSSVDQELFLQLNTAYAEYFNLSASLFEAKEGQYEYAQVLISVPGDAPATTVYPVLNLYVYDETDGTIGTSPVYSIHFRLDIVSGSGASDRSEYILPALLILFAVLEVGGILFLLWTRSRKYRDFRIRDVFVIYKDGRLIKHISTHSGAALDHFTVSSMLTAISNYINDSFRSEKTGARYGELQHGDLRVLVEHGDNVDLAVVVSGEYPPKLKRIMAGTLERIEGAHSLKKWDGDYSVFVNLNQMLRPLIMMQKERKVKPGRGAGSPEAAPMDDERVDRFGTDGGESSAVLAEERKKRLEEMGKRLIATGAVPKEARKALMAHLNSLDDPQVSSFDALMEHLVVDPDGKTVHYVEVPESEKNIDR